MYMRISLLAAAVVFCAACRADTSPTSGEYLFAWAGDSAGKASDFLAVIDASAVVAAIRFRRDLAADGDGRDASAPHRS